MSVRAVDAVEVVCDGCEKIVYVTGEGATYVKREALPEWFASFTDHFCRDCIDDGKCGCTDCETRRVEEAEEAPFAAVEGEESRARGS